ncbi:MAG: KTSC domain-containing protein [Verrucomicrobiota bacterium]
MKRYWLSILIAGLTIGRAETTLAETQSGNERIVSRIPRAPVASGAIASVGYSKRLQILEIEFLNGAIYRYNGVPRSIYHKLMSSPSKAHYFHEHIKGNFPSSRIRKWQTHD